jgi:hypothetical protein
MSLGTLAYGYVGMRRSVLLVQEGLRLRGTVIGHKVIHGIDHSVVMPVVRIDEPPFAGRVETLVSRYRTKAAYPVGSRPVVLAHPTRAIFALDEARPSLPFLLLVMVLGLTFLLIPTWAEWSMK